MKRKFLPIIFTALFCKSVLSQSAFPPKIDTAWSSKTVWLPKSPLVHQTIFVGGIDTVQTTTTYGNPAGKTLAKQWHDFIGFAKVPTNAEGILGNVVVNHEMIQKNSNIGDGCGMTAFKIKRLSGSQQLEVVYQTLPDGRKGKFFNVDFANTVGETGMNCGGISAENGRIWTAEEWMQSSNIGIFASGQGFLDTTDFTIGVTTPAGFPGFNGKKIKRYQNLNWMVEVDPNNAKAIRKQYNWGRAGWEGGVLMPDNKTVYLFEDASPAILAKFVATTAGDFTVGQLYVYKHDAPNKWITIENNLDTLLDLNTVALRRGATMFNRLEWGVHNNGKIYITETGRDQFTWLGSWYANAPVNKGIIKGYKERFKILYGKSFTGTDAQAADSIKQGKFRDYYGRVLVLDLSNDEISSLIEGGPYFGTSNSQNRFAYPEIHLTNPDGINIAKVNGKDYLIIQEDLNGISYNRMPSGISIVCETYLLDLSISYPKLSDLIRITACPPGAEITGGIMIDENTMLFNVQHPNTGNNFPYNNSLTYAISGFKVVNVDNNVIKTLSNSFEIYPNPASNEIKFSKTSDVAIYNSLGQRILVARDVNYISLEGFTSGVYFIKNSEGETIKLVVE